MSEKMLDKMAENINIMFLCWKAQNTLLSGKRLTVRKEVFQKIPVLRTGSFRFQILMNFILHLGGTDIEICISATIGATE